MLTFVATCHSETFEVDMFCNSLLLQKDGRWNCVVFCNGENREIATRMQRYYQQDERFSYVESVSDSGYWGCFNRITALNFVNSEYIVNTSIQDYYTPNAVGEILSHAGRDVIYWDCLHNHHNWNVLHTRLEVSNIDWGCFAVKTEIAKAVGINNPTSCAADGLFVTDIINVGYGNHHKIGKILTVHN
jgi:hypothetical protein